MKVALHVVQARREQLADLVKKHRYLSIGELCKRLDISEATAILKKQNKIRRT